jgi:hypothetical protein
VLNIAIFGCCCTGDIFRLSPEGFKLTLYYARTSITSQMAAPITVDDTKLASKNRFETRCLVQDCRKTFFQDLAALAPDFLIVDMVQEISHHAAIGNGIIKMSSALLASNLEAVTGYRLELLEGLTPATKARWYDACPRFITRLKEIMPAERIIIHRAFWQEKYRDNGRTLPFLPEEIAEGKKRNVWFSEYYDYFAANLPGCNILDINAAGFLASRQHVWGLTPFHYEDGYYLRAAAEIRRITGTAL